MRRRLLLTTGGLAVLLLAGWIFFAGNRSTPPPLVPRNAGAASLRDPALIARGRYLVTIGDCAGCHTAREGAPFAGGLRVATPFGGIAVPNITPDRATGLGSWSFEDFWQAVHDGKGRHGELLYPAFSYTAYTKVTRDDARAMFAYLQSLPPVHQPSAPSSLRFPYSVRSSLLAWRALYFRPGVFVADPQRSAQWNRGAYLVQGLGHCNECHATRDALGGISSGTQLSGGLIPLQNWYAPDLSTQRGGGLQGWRDQDVIDLLHSGQSAKGVAFGPMADVVSTSTQYLSDSDLRAVTAYLQSLPPAPPTQAVAALRDEPAVRRGGKLYATHCADCHGDDGRGVAGIYPPLDGNSAVTGVSGINAIRAVLLGGFAPLTAPPRPRPYSMPPFAQQLSDSEVAAVVSYMRHSWGNRAAVVRPEDVSKYRQTPLD